ncbi:E3 Ubiquitin ligase GIDE-type [Arabidopsis thaliana x Arabidopsis arenosa]|uniref:RING-type E3 ubiquitin transferase n=1 Tax=Arabidopsis thaliana x Arabidopsis arenosa TaxID=1240361 RepID=A0A8T2C180_9BRAS|nr:E3 Ubiquitin ligase GIDE-type [Arabidopsis thaliana x Arabidopsis arenosa]
MEGMLIAAGCCFGISAIMYIVSCNEECEAEILSSVTPVRKLKELGELIGNKTSSLLVAVSGKVGSTTAIVCKRSGVLAVSLTEEAELVFRTKIEEAGDEKKENSQEILRNHSFSTCEWKQESEKITISRKTVPWFLEDDTGQVNVVGFHPSYRRGDLETYVFDEPVNELFQRVLHLKGVKIVRHTVSEEVFKIGTPLSFFAKAFRDTDGTLTIQRTNQLSLEYFQHFRDDKSIDKLVSSLRSASKESFNVSVFFQTVGAVLCAIYVVHRIYIQLGEKRQFYLKDC